MSSLGLTLERAGRDEDALAAYKEAAELLEGLSISSLSKDANAEAFNNARANRELYARRISLLVRRKQAAHALRYLERQKSKTLVDALAGANVKTNDARLTVLIENVKRAGEAVRVSETALLSAVSCARTARENGRRDRLFD